MRLDTRAFGIAGGTVASLATFVLTLLWLAGGRPPAELSALKGVLFGWSVSVGGAFVGAMWAYAYGFVVAALFAFAYNLARAPAAPPPLD